jgi:hypothetical protein
MNLHAEKIDTRHVSDDAAEDLGLGLGGVLSEIHTCPGCRFVLERGERT